MVGQRCQRNNEFVVCPHNNRVAATPRLHRSSSIGKSGVERCTLHHEVGGRRSLVHLRHKAGNGHRSCRHSLFYQGRCRHGCCGKLHELGKSHCMRRGRWDMTTLVRGRLKGSTSGGQKLHELCEGHCRLRGRRLTLIAGRLGGSFWGKKPSGFCNDIGGTSRGQGVLRWWCTIVVCGGVHSLLIPTPKRCRKTKMAEEYQRCRIEKLNKDNIPSSRSKTGRR